MDRWLAGYTQAELDSAQERYGLRFPPDLIALYRDRRPSSGYDWPSEDQRIRKMLAWPKELLLFDIEENGSWWPEWGERPVTSQERAEVVGNALDRYPRLIPLIGHRFIPAEPNSAGNPVFSMHGFDTIYYGANLEEFFDNEFDGTHRVGRTRHIPFWSDIVERYSEVE
jgi:hypothetical protein